MASATVSITVKWGGKEFEIKDMCGTQTMDDLRQEICRLTQVLPERQKILGIKHKGKEPKRGVQLSELNLKAGQKIMMIGTREEQLTDVLTAPTDLPEVINDFDIEEEDEIAVENREEYLAKIEKRVREKKITILNEARLGKKLLVLDIDYTIFDHRSVAENANQLIRPFLHEFMTAVYPFYDIAIWSATGMKWIEVKMKELGVSTHPNYKICFHIDSSFMISVSLPKYGLVDVKPLGVVWGQCSQWDHRNTIMFDDIRKNFIMNPQNGLRIRPFRDAHKNRSQDRELVQLSQYLIDIAELDDLSTLNHRKWEKYRPHKKPSHHTTHGHTSATHNISTTHHTNITSCDLSAAIDSIRTTQPPNEQSTTSANIQEITEPNIIEHSTQSQSPSALPPEFDNKIEPTATADQSQNVQPNTDKISTRENNTQELSDSNNSSVQGSDLMNMQVCVDKDKLPKT